MTDRRAPAAQASDVRERDDVAGAALHASGGAASRIGTVQQGSSSIRLPVLACLACFGLILAGGVAAEMIPLAWAGNWTDHIVKLQPHIVDRFFPFDAVWYQRIADQGYVWDPSHPLSKQDVAFFPVWPSILRVIAAAAPSVQAARVLSVMTAGAFALLSILAFDRLARRILPPDAQRTATWLFALYPGASFLLLSYPTGLMNLGCIVAVSALLDGRLWLAATASGLVSGIEPLGLGTSMAVCCAAMARLPVRLHRPAVLMGAVWRPAIPTVALCLVSVSGLLGFLLWQTVLLGDPFAFIKAQAAWAKPLPWLARIPRAVLQILVLPDIIGATLDAASAARAPNVIAAQAWLEKAIHTLWLGMALVGVAASARLRAWPVLLQGAFTMGLFVWFHSTSRPGNSALRLTYCAIGIFLGLAWLLRGQTIVARIAVGVSACMLFAGAFLGAAGYHVV